jgi:hypothetical protein
MLSSESKHVSIFWNLHLQQRLALALVEDA